MWQTTLSRSGEGRWESNHRLWFIPVRFFSCKRKEIKRLMVKIMYFTNQNKKKPSASRTQCYNLLWLRLPWHPAQLLHQLTAPAQQRRTEKLCYGHKKKSMLKFLHHCLMDVGVVSLCLFSCAGHVHYILNAVAKKGPGVLKVWRRVLKHHQLCGVVDTRQRSPFSVPVHLEWKEWGHKIKKFTLYDNTKTDESNNKMKIII